MAKKGDVSPAEGPSTERFTEESPVLDAPLVEETVIEAVAPAERLVRRVRVQRAYQGALSQEYPILPGLYYEDDVFLYGLADFLVLNQYAEWYA